MYTKGFVSLFLRRIDTYFEQSHIYSDLVCSPLDLLFWAPTPQIHATFFWLAYHSILVPLSPIPLSSIRQRTDSEQNPSSCRVLYV